MRPRGTMERTCSCGLTDWHDPLSLEASVLEYVCKRCKTNAPVRTKCSACNHIFISRHLELRSMWPHPRCCMCTDIPPMQFAKRVHCWCCTCEINGSVCCGDATQEKKMSPIVDSEECWQSWYHVCDSHAEDWTHDKPDIERKAILRKRGAKIIDLGDGAWTFEFKESDTASYN